MIAFLRSLNRIEVAIATAIAVTACVPASEKLPPRGAAGFITEPSAATKGEPFMVAGAWTVTIEKFLVRASVSAQGDRSFSGNGGFNTWTWNAARPVEIYAPGISLGPAYVSVRLTGGYRYDNDDGNGDGSGRVIDVSAEDNDRFFRQADNAPASSSIQVGPSVILRARGERDGRRVSVSLALNDNFGYTGGGGLDPGVLVTVNEDALGAAPLRVEAQRMLVDFDAIANADTDNDGIVTAQELRSTSAPNACPECLDAGFGPQKFNLLEGIVLRANSIFVY